ncbi:hypothetical protein IF1G_09670 [Cordyceps javanica]|uniref:Tat pathway signal sequence n=1 Tax=Cordyceps javanica TaxID=43265 RepID=A0A545VPG6_9HYPO|nr:hypothetical protein IF1G_09670 [Cordyceps javanica]TQW03611.1 hypothetical protein IF2G_08909 [Cordyceps javanica]
MSFSTRRGIQYQLVDEDPDAEKTARAPAADSRLSWFSSCLVAVLAFVLGALFGLFILAAPQRPHLHAGSAESLKQQQQQQQIPSADIPTLNVEIDVISTTFHYNRTFGEAPDHKGTSEAWESIVPVGQGTWSIHGIYYGKVNAESDTVKDDAHMRHCFDYLRQGLMCASDTSLEPVDPELGGVTGWGSRRVCRDYQQVVAWAEHHRVSNLRGFQETPHHHGG